MAGSCLAQLFSIAYTKGNTASILGTPNEVLVLVFKLLLSSYFYKC